MIWWKYDYHWQREEVLRGSSQVAVEWFIEDDVESGLYRIVHAGDSRDILGRIKNYQGISSTFIVL